MKTEHRRLTKQLLRRTAHGCPGSLPASHARLSWPRVRTFSKTRLGSSLRTTAVGLSGRRGVGRRLKKETPQEINSESVIGRAGGMELGGSIYSPRSILSTIFGLLGLIS